MIKLAVYDHASVTNSSGDKYPDAHREGITGQLTSETVEKTANGAITLEKMFAVNAGYFVFMFKHGRPGMGIGLQTTIVSALKLGWELLTYVATCMLHCTYIHDHQCTVWNMTISVLSETWPSVCCLEHDHQCAVWNMITSVLSGTQELFFVCLFVLLCCCFCCCCCFSVLLYIHRAPELWQFSVALRPQKP